MRKNGTRMTAAEMAQRAICSGPDQDAREDPEGGVGEVDQREGHEELPGETRELIDPETEQGAADPDEEHDHADEFSHEPEVGRDELEEGAGRLPAAEEERDAEAAEGGEAEILSHEEQRVFETGVFGQMAGDEFALGLGQIEGRAVGLGEGGDEEDNEAGETQGVKINQCGRKPKVQKPWACAIAEVESVPVTRMMGTTERMRGSS